MDISAKWLVLLSLSCLWFDPCRSQSNTGFLGALAANFAQIFQRRTSTQSETTYEPVTVYLTQYETLFKTETEMITETETSTLSLSWLR